MNIVLINLATNYCPCCGKNLGYSDVCQECTGWDYEYS